MINKNYERIADDIFSYFKNFQPGHGLQLFKIFRGKYNSLEWPQEYAIVHEVIAYNLCENGYFTIEEKDDPFFKITESGYRHLAGDPLILNSVNLKGPCSYGNVEEDFRFLWLLVGDENAPFYVEESIFYGSISQFLEDIPSDYSVFISECNESGKSIPKKIWFRELFTRLTSDDRQSFLENLANKIVAYYE